MPCDVYHKPRMEGDLITTRIARLNRSVHIQVTDNPGRHEPGTGGINFANRFAAIGATR